MKLRPIVVTLTSIPPRFSYLPEKLESLARQTVQPDAIELCIPNMYRRFPGPRPPLPKLPAGVRVIEVEDDLGPATKVLPTAERWRRENVDLLLCDDDRPEDPRWIERFAAARHQRPDDLICEAGWSVDDPSPETRTQQDMPRVVVAPRRGRTAAYHLQRIVSLGLHTPPTRVYTWPGHADIFLGVYGALMTPTAFHPDAWHIPEILWTVDDVWLSGMARANGVKVWVNAVSRVIPRDGPVDRTCALKHHVEQGADRNRANRMCIDYLRKRYAIWI